MVTFAEELGSLWSEGETEAKGMTQIMTTLFKKQPEFFRNDKTRTFIHNWLVSSGSDFLQDANDNNSKLKNAELNADMLVFLEGYDSTKENPFDLDFDFSMKHRDMMQGCKRSIVKFYRKRTPCSCLDEMYAEVKPQPKTGICHHCNGRFERRALKDCTRCRKVQYCCKQCQKADWSHHKEDCKKCSKKLGRIPPAKEGIAPVPRETAASGSYPSARSQAEEKGVLLPHPKSRCQQANVCVCA